MNEFVKWAWLILLIVLFCGAYAFVVLAVDIVAFILVAKFKPEWLDKF